MKTPFFFPLSFLFVFTTLCAQFENYNDQQSAASPDFSQYDEILNAAGSSDDLFEYLDNAFDQFLGISPVKGISAALITPDGSIWKRTKGVSQESPSPVPMTTDHLLGMGSNSKSFVATTILLMYEDGMLHLNDSIGTYLESYPNVPGSATLRQILSHRSGISDYINENPLWFENLFLHIDSIWTIDNLLHAYVLEPNFPPGSSYSYSNTNYLLAGRIIEKITGRPWYEVVRDRILDPFGLSHTFSFPFESHGNQPFSNMWTTLDSIGFTEVQTIYPIRGYFSIANSAGNMITTPEDLVKFRQLLHGGHILLPSTLNEMQNSHSPEIPGLSYGLGVASNDNWLVENWGHTGSWTYLSSSKYSPTEEFGLAVMQNDNRTDSSFDIFDLEVFLTAAYINYEAPTSTKDISDINLLQVFPNPTSGFLSVQFPKESNVTLPIKGQLTNIHGQEMISLILENKQTFFDLNHLDAGIYFIKAGNFVEKIIVK